MKRMIHMSISIVGALKSMETKKANSKSYCYYNNGIPMNVGQARHFLYEELAKGRKVLPLQKCDNFDYQKGCLGHPIKDGEEQ